MGLTGTARHPIARGTRLRVHRTDDGRWAVYCGACGDGRQLATAGDAWAVAGWHHAGLPLPEATR